MNSFGRPLCSCSGHLLGCEELSEPGDEELGADACDMDAEAVRTSRARGLVVP